MLSLLLGRSQRPFRASVLTFSHAGFGFAFSSLARIALVLRTWFAASRPVAAA
jgi:hypothetical protein